MTKNWHVGKILLLWAVDLMILGMVLWGASRPVLHDSLWDKTPYMTPAPFLATELGVWVVVSLPLVVLTWRWLTWRERQQGGQIAREGRRGTGLTSKEGCNG